MQVTNQIDTQTLTSGTRKPKGNLGKDDFLKLLTAKMRYQDPLKPMDDQSFVAQLAQFSALEQMMNVGLSSNLNYGVSMLGKKIVATGDDGKSVTGTAMSVRVQDGKPMIKINVGAGKAPVEVDLSKVSQVDA